MERIISFLSVPGSSWAWAGRAQHCPSRALPKGADRTHHVPSHLLRQHKLPCRVSWRKQLCSLFQVLGRGDRHQKTFWGSLWLCQQLAAPPPCQQQGSTRWCVQPKSLFSLNEQYPSQSTCAGGWFQERAASLKEVPNFQHFDLPRCREAGKCKTRIKW